MRQTFTTNFYCRSSKADRNGQSPVEMGIIINGDRSFIQLPYSTTPGEFKKLTESRKQNQLKDYLDEIRMRVRDVQIEMLRSGVPFTTANLKAYFITGGVKTFTVGDLFDEYLSYLRKRVGNDLTFKAYKKYQNAFDCFAKFYDRSKEVTTVAPGIMQRFLVDCQSKYQDSTTCGIMTKIKTVFTYALDNGYIRTNPFVNIKFSKGKKDIEYLTAEEIGLLMAKEMPVERLEKVKDVAVFQMCSGLAYADCAALKREDYKFTADGTCYINKKRCKTGTEFTSVVFPEGVEVLKKYDFCLPVISNQRMNAYLKEIQTLCGITKNLHCHLFRKTYATRLLCSGVRLEVVSKALGHANTLITQQAYAKLLNNTVVDEVSKIF